MILKKYLEDAYTKIAVIISKNNLIKYSSEL